MRTTQAYNGKSTRAGRSEKSDKARSSALPKARIRALLVVRGTSLRAWAVAWARRQGIRDPKELARTYNACRMAVNRWAHRPDAPPDPTSLTARLMADLLAEIGDAQRPAAAPMPGAAPSNPAGGPPAPDED
jgi:hypothetical protein